MASEHPSAHRRVSDDPPPASPPSPNHYTTRDVSRLLDVSRGRVRAFARSGVLRPDRGERGEYRFAFQDLVLLRTARALEAERIPKGRVHRAFRIVASHFPRTRSLSELQFAAQGRQLVVRDGPHQWNPESGQFELNLEPPGAARAESPPTRVAEMTVAYDTDADDWYVLGVESETSAPAIARDAYRRAIRLDPGHADAHVNLGRLLQEDGRAGEAVAHYQQALAVKGAHAMAAFNLGIALEDLNRPIEAMRAYERAIRGDANLADAYYNLSRLYERCGKPKAALRCLSQYKKLTGRD